MRFAFYVGSFTFNGASHRGCGEHAMITGCFASPGVRSSLLMLPAEKMRETTDMIDMGEAFAEELLFDQAAFVVDVVAVGIIVLRIYVNILSIKRDFPYHRDDKRKGKY